VTPLGWLAALGLFAQLPIPLYWFVMHPQIDFWRSHRSAGYAVALLLAWVPVSVFLVTFRRELFLHTRPPLWSAILGLVRMSLKVWISWRRKRDLGASRLIGQTELSGGEAVCQGIYAHPNGNPKSAKCGRDLAQLTKIIAARCRASCR
jgi:hypothetical protein